MEQPKQKTEGEKRVRLDFNPNALPRVTEIKTLMAKAIDAIEDIEKQVKENAHPVEKSFDLGSFLREAATAKTEIQKASMCAVLAMTNEVTFQLIPAIVAASISEVPPHIARVLIERKELDEKVRALDAFIKNSQIFKDLPRSKSLLMRKQLEVMEQYILVLNQRLDLEGYE